MSVRNRVVLAVMWALSLVAVSQLGASAEGQVVPIPDQQPGYEVRFVYSGGQAGSQTGSLLARIGGKWVPVQLELPESKPGIRPLR